jgi:hypothetical protein
MREMYKCSECERALSSASELWDHKKSCPRGSRGIKFTVIGLGAALILVTVGFAQQQGTRTFTGEITDSTCAMLGSHEMMIREGAANDARSCTNACVKTGNSQYVLYDASTKTIYQLSDQQKPVQFAGQKVTITGTYQPDTKTIQIASIQ